MTYHRQIDTPLIGAQRHMLLCREKYHITQDSVTSETTMIVGLRVEGIVSTQHPLNLPVTDSLQYATAQHLAVR